MTTAEIAFWLRWYDEWDGALRDGEEAVTQDSYYELCAEPKFERTVLRLHSLLSRVNDAPVPKSFENYYLGADEDEDGADWPVPGIPAEAASGLRTLVRGPCLACWRDPAMPMRTEMDGISRLYAQIRAAELLDASNNEESSEIAVLLRQDLACDLPPSDFDFLASSRVSEILTQFDLNISVMTPFHKFVEADLSLERLVNRPDHWGDPGDPEELVERDADQCEVCWDWDDPCQLCQERQDAFDACDDSHPDYYD